MSDRDLILAHRVRLLALPRPTDVVLHVGNPVSRLERGAVSLSLRLDPRALPLANGGVRATCAAHTMRAACAGRHDIAFAELLRATQDGGRVVVAEDDAAGTVGAEHRAAVAAGWVPSQMEAVPSPSPDVVRLFVVFKPGTDKGTSSERGHGTH
jgi:hypothetical protein